LESVKSEIAVKSFSENIEREGPCVAFPTVIAAIARAIKYYSQAIDDSLIREDHATNWGDSVMDAYIGETQPPATGRKYVLRKHT